MLLYIVLSLLVSGFGQECNFDDECTSYSEAAFCYEPGHCECFAGYQRQQEYCIIDDENQQECQPIFSRCPPKLALIKNSTDQVALECKVKGVIETCKWRKPDGTEITPSVGDYRYKRTNVMDDSFCNLKITKPEESDHGNWTCVPLVKEDSSIQQFNSSSTKLLLLRAPKSTWPSIEYEDKIYGADEIITIDEGKSIIVGCKVGESRPKANIAWYLAKDLTIYWRRVYRRDLTKKPIDRTAPIIFPNAKYEDLTKYSKETVIPVLESYPDMVSTKSFLTLTVTRDYNNKQLYCNVTHQGLKDALSKSVNFNVLYKPTFSKASDHAWFTSGSVARQRVRFDCNPPPKQPEDVKILIDGIESIKSGQSSADGVVSLSEFAPLPGSDGTKFEVTVTLAPISSYYTKQSYTLTVTNHLSSPQEHHVYFYETPSGEYKRIGVSTGWIILAIVIVLGSLLIYYTWMTSKFCFKQSSDSSYELLIQTEPTVISPMLHK